MHKKLKCQGCGAEDLRISRCDDCLQCEHNGVWDEEKQKYVYKEKLAKGEKRTQIQDAGRCEVGWGGSGAGCLIVMCHKCGHLVSFVPMKNCSEESFESEDEERYIDKVDLSKEKSENKTTNYEHDDKIRFSYLLNEKPFKELEEVMEKYKEMFGIKTPAKFRKKPVVIEAMKLTKENWEDVRSWIVMNDPKSLKEVVKNEKGEVTGIIIHTLEGDHLANMGDFIIKGIKGEFYPCKPDIFVKTYEVVRDENA